MDDKIKNIYYEQSLNHTMPTYPFFIDKLKHIEKIVGSVSNGHDLAKISNIKPHNCSKCLSKKIYQTGGIIWPNNIKHKIMSHQRFPSEYFIKCILNICIINNSIVNPPIHIDPGLVNYFNYIPLHYNKLLIIDALMHEGSYPRYENNGKYIYSEHSGVISIRNKSVESIIVLTDTNRTDVDDNNIFLPVNSPQLLNYEYLFHTHPNTSKYGGRINEGIIYEFPSANDIFNFIKYYADGKAQASLIVSPEGTYLIRPITFTKNYKVDQDFFYYLLKFILRLERLAMKRIYKFIPEISNPDIFHEKVGMDFKCIKSFNRFIEPINLFIEYYPREKKNGEWVLRPINLPFIELSTE